MKIEQQIRGTTAENNAWLFPSGTITVDEDLKELRLHDGVTMGGVAFPNTATIVGFGNVEFLSVVTMSVPGAIAGGDVGKLIQITTAGTYTVPTVVGKTIGSRLKIQALVAGVVIDPFVGESISDIGVDLATTSISNKETLTLAVLDGSKWLVVNRY